MPQVVFEAIVVPLVDYGYEKMVFYGKPLFAEYAPT